jgi:hypothetical protein
VINNLRTNQLKQATSSTLFCFGLEKGKGCDYKVIKIEFIAYSSFITAKVFLKLSVTFIDSGSQLMEKFKNYCSGFRHRLHSHRGH